MRINRIANWIFTVLGLLLLLGTGLGAQELPSSIYTLPIQRDGRVKPLDTFARTTVRSFVERERIDERSPMELFLRLVFEPAEGRQERIVRIDHPHLKNELKLDAGRHHFAWTELPPSFARLMQTVRPPDSPDGAFDPALNSLYQKYQLRDEIEGGLNLALVPAVRGDRTQTWRRLHSISHDVSPGTPEARAVKAFETMGAMWKDQDLVGLDGATASFRAAMSELSGGTYPTAADFGLELQYNRLAPFHWAWLCYLAGFVLLAVSLTVKGKKWITIAGFVVMTLGFALHTHGLVLRTIVLDRVPVSNMWESIIFVGWVTVLVALILEVWLRIGWVGCLAGLGAAGAVLAAENLPVAGSELGMLNAVLRSNFWLTTHVLTIVASYALFLLAAMVGHVGLLLASFRPSRWSLYQTFDRVLYIFLKIGVVLLIAGTLLGGMWANESWGRFWGWDPKETWSLITCLGYLALLHARRAGWLHEFGMAAGSVVSFVLVIMTWYGVNYVLGTGLHTYGGSGASGMFWFLFYVVAELLFVTVTAIVVRMRSGQQVQASLPKGASSPPATP